MGGLTMKQGRKLALLFLLVFTAALLGGCNSSGNVGVIDVNKVMTESPKVKQFQEQLNVKGKELSDQLEKDKASLSAADFQKKQETLYAEFMKFPCCILQDHSILFIMLLISLPLPLLCIPLASHAYMDALQN